MIFSFYLLFCFRKWRAIFIVFCLYIIYNQDAFSYLYSLLMSCNIYAKVMRKHYSQSDHTRTRLH
jgi:hypothetical protein